MEDFSILVHSVLFCFASIQACYFSVHKCLINWVFLDSD